MLVGQVMIVEKISDEEKKDDEQRPLIVADGKEGRDSWYARTGGAVEEI